MSRWKKEGFDISSRAVVENGVPRVQFYARFEDGETEDLSDADITEFLSEATLVFAPPDEVSVKRFEKSLRWGEAMRQKALRGGK